MESGRVRWREMDTEDQILGKDSGEMEQQHLDKDTLKIEMDLVGGCSIPPMK